MDYLYENLGDERFQEFCSCLISKEFPNMQAFPIGQPDGGRDSLVYIMDSKKKGFFVFQVKFVRNASETRDLHKWLTDTIENEVVKINELIPKGAISYYLLTNIKGTAHLDSGSKDKVNKILEEKIKIPSLCWWRDDLSRMFEKDPIFKWSFPEILNGQDVLNSILFENLQENKERRENVIRAYLVDQYEIDNEVKFKQIDLQNRLLNLYIDVPIRIKKFNEKNKSLKRILGFLTTPKQFITDEDVFVLDEGNNMCAAEFILHPKVQSEIERILLEGGPGQGKSTISQYICQVQRAKLLNKLDDQDLLPLKIKNSPVRLPFKIDLRDLAAWVEKKNPYDGILSQEYFNSIWRNSLEAFLVAHIFYHSKLEEFNSTDFIAICKLSPILLVFDGFDEIANIKSRGEVIEFINKGITRISANTKSLQVIITSRPAAFSDSVGFSIENYPHFELSDITLPIINEYVEKWIKASRIDHRDAKELRKLIKEKLELPHLKDLAKSPMQLAIFISLLRTKGQSLPNKRTALYDSYIELFFDRESEKNKLIRDKRDLIIDIHQYLAWVLHSEAELFKNSGSININELNIRLKDYLSREGQDTSLADQLFDIMKERVCALVSRVQGTFEFEVQPLREYFCAKYLYKSAPHSSAGNIKHGTKPDRLHAILRNHYWQNVVRFFAGCADAGELDMIIHELKELQNDNLLRYTNYPRIITSQILSDYVFTQKPLKLKDVVKIIIDGINTGNVINQDGRMSSNEPLILPNECGRNEVILECFQQLIKLPKRDIAAELIGILNNNPLDILEKWLEYLPTFRGEELTKWLEYAYDLELIYKIDGLQLQSILKDGDITQTKKRLQLIIRGNRLKIVDNDIELKNILFTGIINSELSAFPRNKSDHSLNYLTLITHPYIVSNIFRNDDNITFINHTSQFFERHLREGSAFKSLPEFPIQDDIDRKIKTFADSISEICDTPLGKFKNNIDPWDMLVESGRLTLGDNWSLKIIATIAAGIKSKDELYDAFEDLNDNTLSLCKRVRNARMKSGNAKYWEKQIDNSTDLPFTLLVFFTWATSKTIIQLLPTLTPIIKSLDQNTFSMITNGISSTKRNSLFDKAQEKFIEENMKHKKNMDEIKYILSLRFEDLSSQKYLYKNLEKYTGVLANFVEKKFKYLVRTYLEKPTEITILEEIEILYKHISDYDEKYYFRRNSDDSIEIPFEIAQKIMKNRIAYPRIICSFAEKSCRLYANEHLKPIGEIAKVEKWFEGN